MQKLEKTLNINLNGNEKFITEARMYHKMDKQYSLICVNEAVEVGEYKEDGYTRNILSTFKSSPEGYYQYFKEILQMGLKDMILKKKIYVIKHFIWFSVIRKLVK